MTAAADARPARGALIVIAAAVLGGVITLLIAVALGLPSGFDDPDESAHYVNALFLGDWLRAGLPSPMAFAQGFYAHFPKLSIGHWPPGWYALLAPGFALLRPSPQLAHGLSAFLAGVPAALIVWGGRRCGATGAGLAGAVAYLFLPLVVDGAEHFLLDQPVTLVVGLAAIAWARASARPSWGNCLLFAALAAAAPLVKGNGALVALVPGIDIALTKRWRLLARPPLWGAAAAAMAVVAPWYWISFKISAGGFNYAPGPAYAWLAFTDNAAAIVANVGVAGVALAAIGLWLAWRGRSERPEAARVAALGLSVILATLVFQSLVPAALAPRYVSPLLPWLVLLAAIGAAESWQRGLLVPRVAVVCLAGAALVPALRNLATMPPAPDIRAPVLAEIVGKRPGIWLVDGRAGGEGAVIAAAAYADGGQRRIWVARASQWLSQSDFMGRNYQVTARTPGAARAVLDRLGVQGVISIAARNQPAYPHSTILRAAVMDPAFARQVLPFRAGVGSTLIATRIGTARPDPALLSSGSGSANVAKMNAAIR